MSKLHINPRVAQLAKMLSEKTGTDFRVLRTPEGIKPVRYALRAKSSAGEWTFFHRGANAALMVLYLATMLDMIDMGFVPVKK